MMPIPVAGVLDEVQERIRQSIASRTEMVEKYDRADEEKQLWLGELAEVTENLDWVMRRTDLKMQETEFLMVKLREEQTVQCRLQQKLSTLTTKLNQVDQRIQQDQTKLAQLKKNRSKVRVFFAFIRSTNIVR
jgi:chromosome segregation ATPase